MANAPTEEPLNKDIEGGVEDFWYIMRRHNKLSNFEIPLPQAIWMDILEWLRPPTLPPTFAQKI